jgi:hypothetical protein
MEILSRVVFQIDVWLSTFGRSLSTALRLQPDMDRLAQRRFRIGRSGVARSGATDLLVGPREAAGRGKAELCASVRESMQQAGCFA